MGFKKYELRVLFVIDDLNESAVEQVSAMIKEIQSGEIQRELLSAEGFTNVIATLQERK
jgi:hypothetical protein